MMGVQGEMAVLLYVVLGGAGTAFVYDLLRIKRKMFSRNKIATNIEDVLFWVFAAIVLFLCIYAGNDGEPRFYSVVGYFCGILIYLVFLSKIVRKVIEKILTVLIYILKKVFTIVFWPIKMLWKGISATAQFFWRLLKRLFGPFLQNLVKKRKQAKLARRENAIRRRKRKAARKKNEDMENGMPPGTPGEIPGEDTVPVRRTEWEEI